VSFVKLWMIETAKLNVVDLNLDSPTPSPASRTASS